MWPPSALAPYGVLAILSWIVMGAGAICLGLTFARLSRLAPATGGPYAYSRMGFGDFAGFLVAWGYWISIWASLPAIAVDIGIRRRLLIEPQHQPAAAGLRGQFSILPVECRSAIVPAETGQQKRPFVDGLDIDERHTDGNALRGAPGRAGGWGSGRP